MATDWEKIADELSRSSEERYTRGNLEGANFYVRLALVAAVLAVAQKLGSKFEGKVHV